MDLRLLVVDNMKKLMNQMKENMVLMPYINMNGFVMTIDIVWNKCI